MKSGRLRNPLFIRFVLPFLFFLLLTFALSWPAITTFTTQYIGEPNEDPPHNIWYLWHVKEAVLGRSPLYDAPLLYYPEGISLHLHGIGPLMGVLALPFWPLGATAAYNGAVLLAFAFSGYAVYLLARGVGLSRTAALFTGIFYSMTPMHLGGFFGHFEKIFTALLPLVLLTTLFTMDKKRSRWWGVGTAVLLLSTLLLNGLLFIEAALSAAFFILMALFRSDRPDRPELWRRIGLTAVLTTLLVTPLLISTVKATENPNLRVDLNFASRDFQPDLLEFIVPPPFSRLFGQQSERALNSFQIKSQIEKYVYLSWIGLALAATAVIKRRYRAWPWLLLSAGWAVLAFGPTLQILGQRTFTEYELPIIMPYSLFTMLPGLDFLRTPGRLMLMGFVGFSITAGIGLQYLLEKWPRRRWAIVGGLSLLVCLESWPQPWSVQPIRATPPFYETIAADTAEYGVLDLPLEPPDAEWYVTYASRYQLDQMTHGKGIATGYISRPYQTHPLFPCLIPTLRPPQDDIQVNGKAADCTANILYELAYYNYRYVVWHKPQPGDSYSPNPAEVEAASGYLLNLLGSRPPLVDDEMTAVYAVPVETAESAPTIGLLYNWYDPEGGRRWAKSPASLFISTPHPQDVRLIITPFDIYDPQPGQSVGRQGTLVVSLNGEFITELMIQTGQPATIPLSLPAGIHTISLSLAAGNFRPIDVGGGMDSRLLSFAIQTINLETLDNPAAN